MGPVIPPRPHHFDAAEVPLSSPNLLGAALISLIVATSTNPMPLMTPPSIDQVDPVFRYPFRMPSVELVKEALTANTLTDTVAYWAPAYAPNPPQINECYL